MTPTDDAARESASGYPPPAWPPPTGVPTLPPWVQRAAPKPPVALRVEVQRGVVVAAALAVLGLPAGLAWALLTPSLGVQKLGSPAYLLPATSEDRASIAGDLVMVAILLLVGVLAALAVLVWSRAAQVGPAIGLLVGCTICGLIAMAIGHHLVEADYHAVFAHASDGTVFQIRPYVRGRADFVVAPLIAALVFLVGQLPAMWADGTRTRAARRSASPVSSDSDAYAPSTEPGPNPVV